MNEERRKYAQDYLYDHARGAGKLTAMDEFAIANGFENAQELIQLTTSFDISTPEKLGAFERWKVKDGSKEGLLKLRGEAG